jgi:hypothetical protein
MGMKFLIYSIIPVWMTGASLFSWVTRGPEKSSKVKEIAYPTITWQTKDQNLENHIKTLDHILENHIKGKRFGSFGFEPILPPISEIGESTIFQQEPLKDSSEANDEGNRETGDSSESAEYFDCEGSLCKSEFFKEVEKDNQS